MQPLRAILFDLDETLLDEDGAFHQAVKLTCEAIAPDNNLDPDRLSEAYIRISDYNRSPEGSARLAAANSQQRAAMRLHVWRQALEKMDEYDDTLAAKALEIYARHREEIGIAFPDAQPLLDQLHGRYKLAIVSNGLTTQQRSKLRVSGLESYFDSIAISEELGYAKPDPRIFIHALSELEVRPEEAICIGDNLHADVAGANAAGVTSVWLNRNAAQRNEGEPRPDYEVASLDEFKRLLDGLRDLRPTK